MEVYAKKSTHAPSSTTSTSDSVLSGSIGRIFTVCSNVAVSPFLFSISYVKMKNSFLISAIRSTSPLQKNS